MARTIGAAGIKAPNGTILAENVLKTMGDGKEIVVFLVEPENHEGLEALARKYGYTAETSPSGKLLEVRLTPADRKQAEVDVTGETCPGPVITVSNCLSALAPGERLKVKSSSADTLDDIVMAVRSSGSSVVNRGAEGDRHYLLVEKGEKPSSSPGASPVKDRVLVVQSNGIGNAEKAYATFIFSKVALSMGKTVTVFLLMDGASIGRAGAAAGVKHPEFDRLDRLMGEVIAAGARVYVCELSAKFRGIKPADLVPGVRMAGAATYLDLLSDTASAIVNF